MQDLTLINADGELSLHTSDPRTRREASDDMSSGSSTLPRAKSSSARQGKAARHGQHTGLWVEPSRVERTQVVSFTEQLCYLVEQGLLELSEVM